MSTTSSLGSVNSSADTSALESVLSALNDGSSGIDVATTVDSIISAEEEPMDAWETQQTTLGDQTTEIDQLESEASAVAEQLISLQDAGGIFSNVDASSSDSSVVTASATSGTTTGTHTVTVNSLATAASWYTDEVASSSTDLSSGTFTITQGSQKTNITVGSGVDTLSDLASAINDDSLGITASVVTDADGARLSLVADDTGSDSDFSVSDTNSLGVTRSATGADASLDVDGTPITSASNTVTARSKRRHSEPRLRIQRLGDHLHRTRYDRRRHDDHQPCQRLQHADRGCELELRLRQHD